MDIGALFELLLLTVAHNRLRVIGVGDHLALPRAELVKAVGQRVGSPKIAGNTQAPLAIHAGGITSRLEDLGQHRHFLDESKAIFRSIATGEAATRVLACHQRVAGRGADGIGRVVVGELDAPGGEAIDVGCLEFLLPEAGDVAVAEVIGEDVDDIWRSACTSFGRLLAGAGTSLGRPLIRRGALALRALGRCHRVVNGEE